MNEILQDFINTGEVTSFIDNIIVKTKEEKGHNKVVEKVYQMWFTSCYLRSE